MEPRTIVGRIDGAAEAGHLAQGAARRRLAAALVHTVPAHAKELVTDLGRELASRQVLLTAVPDGYVPKWRSAVVPGTIQLRT